MTFDELKELAKAGESESLEFKETTGQLKRAFETVCAFLNHKGGIVIIGINNKGNIIGQEVTDNTQQEIVREMTKLDPQPYPSLEVEYITVSEHKKVILLKVTSGEQVPYFYDGRAWQRDQTVTRRMAPQRQELLSLKRNQQNFSWERLFAPKYTIHDLDEDLIISLVHKAVEEKRLPGAALRQEVPQLLESLHLSEDGKIRNAAVVLFGKRMSGDFLQCQLKLARFKGLTRQEFIDSDVVSSNFFDMLEKGGLFVKRHLPVAAKIVPGQFERIEIPLIPFNAVREALINALCHRDYSIYGGSVSLAIYDDRMEISSHGSLLPHVTLEKIRAGFSKPRNPLMADVLYRCNFIERWGRGIQEILQACQAAGDPEPDFMTDDVEFRIIFRYPNLLGLKDQTDFLYGYLQGIQGLTTRQIEIVRILRNTKVHNLRYKGELTITEILGQLMKQQETSLSIRTLRYDLARLREIGAISSSGRAQSAKWFFNMEWEAKMMHYLQSEISGKK